MSDTQGFALTELSKYHPEIIQNIKDLFTQAYISEHQLKFSDAIYSYNKVIQLSKIHNLFHLKAHQRIAKLNLLIGNPMKALNYLKHAYTNNIKSFTTSKKTFEDCWRKIIYNFNKELDTLKDLNINYRNFQAKDFVNSKISFFNNQVSVFESLPVKDVLLKSSIKKLKIRMQKALHNYKKQFSHINNYRKANNYRI